MGGASVRFATQSTAPEARISRLDLSWAVRRAGRGAECRPRLPESDQVEQLLGQFGWHTVAQGRNKPAVQPGLHVKVVKEPLGVALDHLFIYFDDVRAGRNGLPANSDVVVILEPQYSIAEENAPGRRGRPRGSQAAWSTS